MHQVYMRVYDWLGYPGHEIAVTEPIHAVRTNSNTIGKRQGWRAFCILWTISHTFDAFDGKVASFLDREFVHPYGLLQSAVSFRKLP